MHSKITLNDVIRRNTGIILLCTSSIYLAFIILTLPEYIYYGNLKYCLLYFLPKVIPLLIIGIYLTIRNPPPNKYLNNIYKTLVVIAAITAITVSIALFFYTQYDLNKILTSDYNWSISGWLVWNYTFILLFSVSYLKTKEINFSFTYAILGISVGGLLYELPICYSDPQVFYHVTFPLYVNTQWMSLFFLGFLMYKKHWKSSKLFLAALICYTTFSAVYLTFGNATYFYNAALEWIPRLPTSIFLACIPLAFKNNPKHQLNPQATLKQKILHTKNRIMQHQKALCHLPRR